MTASSFSSLSLDPPLVLVSVDQRARLHQLLCQTGRYGVSILAKGQDALSTHFAGRPGGPLRIPWIEAEGLPFLDGALAHLACDVVEAVPGGDHIIYIGRITHAQVWPDREPLLYHGGNYGTLSVLKWSVRLLHSTSLQSIICPTVSHLARPPILFRPVRSVRNTTSWLSVGVGAVYRLRSLLVG